MLDNTLHADSLKVQAISDQAITSTARTDGSYVAGFIASGSAKGEASTGAVYNVVLDKVQATVTGNALLKSDASADAHAVGAMPGALSVAGDLESDIQAGVGTEKNRQTSKVLIGSNTELNATGTLAIQALNYGEAKAEFRQGYDISLADECDSSQPTDSWYDTGIDIGDGAKLVGGENSSESSALNLLSRSGSRSTSEVVSKNVGIMINSDTMMGQVTVHSDNSITIGAKAELSAKGDIALKIADSAKALAHTDMSGGGIYDGSTSRAEAVVTRADIITLGKGASVASEKGELLIENRSGDGDDIQVIMYLLSGGLISSSDARVDATVTSNNEIHLLEGVNLSAKKDVRVQAVAGSHGGEKKGGSGIYVYPKVEAGSGYD